MSDKENDISKVIDKSWPLIIPNPNEWHHKVKEIVSAFGLLLVLIVILGIIYLLFDIVSLYFSSDLENRFSKLRTSLFILAALIGTPFFLWRTWIAQQQSHIADRQAETARDRAYTELFTKAIEQLGAEKPKKEDVFDKKGKRILDATGQAAMRETFVPNIEVRIGAIYALERIMKDSDKDAAAVVDTLAAYIRENCGEPQELECEIPKLQNGQSIADWVNAIKIYVGSPHTPEGGSLIARARALKNQTTNRADIKTALTVLGRRPLWLKDPSHSKDDKRQKADLSNVNLQGWDLTGIDLEHCNLTNAKMQGAYMRSTQMQGAYMRSAKMQGAYMYRAEMQGADMMGAQMQGAVMDHAKMKEADMYRAQMQGANMTFAKMQGAKMNFAEMQRAFMDHAQMKGAKMYRAQMQGANMMSVEMQGADMMGAQMQGAFMYHAEMQRALMISAKMQGANMNGAEMQGAYMNGAEINEVQITEAQKTAASVIWVDFTKAEFDFEKLQAQLPEMFGHKEHTTLPEGMAIPEHWSEADMDIRKGNEQYNREWAAFKKKMGVA